VAIEYLHFTCTDCGIDVFWFSGEPPDPRRCVTCQAIADLPDEEERIQLRARLQQEPHD
jgi:hypothetical protein